MRLIEIRLDSGLLLIGSPVAFDRVLLNAADCLAASAAIRMLQRDSRAMAVLRAQLRTIYPALPANALGNQDVVGLLRKELDAGRMMARLLRESEAGIPEVRLADATEGVVHVPLSDRTILIAMSGGLPREFVNAGGVRDSRSGQLSQLLLMPDQMAVLERQACRLPGMSASLRGRSLTQLIDMRVAQGQLDCVVLDDRFAVARAAQRADAPRAISELDQGEKVAAAITRSRVYLSGAVLNAVEEMVRPENLVIMAAVILGVALAQLNPVSAAVVDGTLVILAWTFAGLAGIRAVGTLVNATATAIGAEGEADIDAAAKLYAEAFVGLGAGVLQALLTRSLGRRASKSEEGFYQKRLSEGTGETVAKPAAAPSPPPPPPKPPKPPATQTRTGKSLKNEVEWTLDDQGRPIKAKATLASLQKQGIKRGDSETRAQEKIGGRGKNDDDAGHIIGHRFMGDQGEKNLFPQNANFNRGAYKKLENEWAEWIKNGGTVKSEVELIGGTADRPDKIRVAYEVFDKQGKKVHAKKAAFDNVQGQKFDRVSTDAIKKAMKKK